MQLYGVVVHELRIAVVAYECGRGSVVVKAVYMCVKWRWSRWMMLVCGRGSNYDGLVVNRLCCDSTLIVVVTGWWWRLVGVAQW